MVPTIALGGFSAVLDLDQPAWRVDRLQWCSGRVDVARLDHDRVAAFNALAGERLVEVRDGAVRWATPPGVPLGVDLLDVAPLGLAAAAYEAWTGEAADLDPLVSDVDDANDPVLWLWTDEDPARLAAAVGAALPGHEVETEQEYGALSPVVVRPPAGRVAQADLLADLRTAVAAGTPAWAGLLPRGGFLPPASRRSCRSRVPSTTCGCAATGPATCSTPSPTRSPVPRSRTSRTASCSSPGPIRAAPATPTSSGRRWCAISGWPWWPRCSATGCAATPRGRRSSSDPPTSARPTSRSTKPTHQHERTG